MRPVIDPEEGDSPPSTMHNIGWGNEKEGDGKAQGPLVLELGLIGGNFS